MRVVIGPGFPFPIIRPSALTTGTISAAVPVRKAFVGHENVVPREICLDHFDVELASNIKHDRSRDSL